MDAKKHTASTGAPAKISAKEGTKFPLMAVIAVEKHFTHQR